MLTDRRPGRICCEYCGTELLDETGGVAMVRDEVHGGVYCLRCKGRTEGYEDALRDQAAERARAAILGLVQIRGGDVDGTREMVGWMFDELNLGRRNQEEDR